MEFELHLSDPGALKQMTKESGNIIQQLFQQGGRSSRTERWLSLASWILFAIALWIIARELHRVGLNALWRSFSDLPLTSIALALLLTPPAYLLLTGYDFLGFKYINRSLPWRRIVFAASIGYAYSNSISMTPSIAIRYRLYSRWGVPSLDIAKVVFFHYISTWIGFFAIGGLILIIDPGPIANAPVLAFDHRRWMGAALLLALGGYLWLSTRHDLALHIKKLELPFPGPRIVIPQTLISAADWALMGIIPYLLLPIQNELSYFSFISVFLFAQIVQIISHVPGGIGVFESVIILLLKDYAPSASILAALLVYRVIFLILPLGIASLLLIIYEFKNKRGEDQEIQPRRSA